jgi:hypothetical protein
MRLDLGAPAMVSSLDGRCQSVDAVDFIAMRENGSTRQSERADGVGDAQVLDIWSSGLGRQWPRGKCRSGVNGEGRGGESGRGDVIWNLLGEISSLLVK